MSAITPKMIEAGIAASLLVSDNMAHRFTRHELIGIVKRVYLAMEGAKHGSPGNADERSADGLPTRSTGALVPIAQGSEQKAAPGEPTATE